MRRTCAKRQFLERLLRARMRMTMRRRPHGKFALEGEKKEGERVIEGEGRGTEAGEAQGPLPQKREGSHGTGRMRGQKLFEQEDVERNGNCLITQKCSDFHDDFNRRRAIRNAVGNSVLNHSM